MVSEHGQQLMLARISHSLFRHAAIVTYSGSLIVFHERYVTCSKSKHTARVGHSPSISPCPHGIAMNNTCPFGCTAPILQLTVMKPRHASVLH